MRLPAEQLEEPWPQYRPLYVQNAVPMTFGLWAETRELFSKKCDNVGSQWGKNMNKFKIMSYYSLKNGIHGSVVFSTTYAHFYLISDTQILVVIELTIDKEKTLGD